MTDTIKAESRTEFGKGAARRIRRAAKVPAVLYGHGEDPVHITLPGHETMMALKHGGANAVVEIDVDGKTQLALTKQVQTDPVKGFIEHVDFVMVRRGEKVTVEVPVHVVGEAAAGALVVIELNTVTVEAEATSIPESADVDVTDAAAGTQFLAGDLELRDGATVQNDHDALVVNVTHAPTEAEIEAELEEAEAEAGIERDESDEEIAEAEAAEGDTAGESGESAEGSDDE